MCHSIVAGVCHHHIRFDDKLPYPDSGTNHDFSIRYCPICSLSRDVAPAHDPKTPYSIVAGVCQHHIRFDTQRPYPLSDSNLDFSIRYCPDCLDEQLLAKEHSQALEDYSLYGSFERDDPDRIEARRRLDAARLDRVFHEYNREDHTAELLASSPAHLRPIPLTQEERDFIHGPSARLDPAIEHVDEEYYREQEAFRRRCSEYSPGRYADTSGRGYINTSDPDAALREDRGRDRAAAAGTKRDVTPHPTRLALRKKDERRELRDQQQVAEAEEEKDEKEEEERIRKLKDTLHKYRDVED
ncbi:hypothetical protein MMC32_002492 [Xylographa parallela]|nr:hypothetical protein [Xylographa parallela]